MTAGDPTLVRRALAGETGAAEALFARHFDAVWRVAFGVTAHRYAADDVAQATFERAFRSLSDFSGPGEFAAWLRRIAVNQALDHLRRVRRRRASEVALGDAGAEWEDVSPDPEVAAAVRALVPDRRASRGGPSSRARGVTGPCRRARSPTGGSRCARWTPPP